MSLHLNTYTFQHNIQKHFCIQIETSYFYDKTFKSLFSNRLLSSILTNMFFNKEILLVCYVIVELTMLFTTFHFILLYFTDQNNVLLRIIK